MFFNRQKFGLSEQNNGLEKLQVYELCVYNGIIEYLD